MNPPQSENSTCPLEVRALHYSYPDGHKALNGVSFRLRENEKLALVGPNGSGKSTLLLHLAGGIAARQGEIRLHGRPAGTEDLRRAVGLIFQEPDDQLFMPQVADDVAFGLVARGVPAAEARRKAMEMLDRLGAAHLAERPPHRLSGGEKRLAALAGILVMEPQVIVLDEPTSALDPRARRRVIETLRALSQPLILTTHDLDMALDVCSRAALLYDGAVAAEGPLPDLFRDKELLERNGLELPLRYSAT
ncbi:energy-coupling factor ABC transporter ATP-binding protein [Pyramidobacter porci]